MERQVREISSLTGSLASLETSRGRVAHALPQFTTPLNPSPQVGHSSSWHLFQLLQCHQSQMCTTAATRFTEHSSRSDKQHGLLVRSSTAVPSLVSADDCVTSTTPFPSFANRFSRPVTFPQLLICCRLFPAASVYLWVVVLLRKPGSFGDLIPAQLPIYE